MEPIIEGLNQEDAVVDTTNIINRDDCSIEIGVIGRRAYLNSAKGREELMCDCNAQNMPELYDRVMSVWGDEPTIVEPEESPLPFEALKAEKLQALEYAFDTRVSGSFVCSQGWPMQFDRSDTLAVEGAVQLLKATGQTTGYLTDANDVTHYDMPIATMEAVKIEMLAAYAHCHARKQELRAQINAAQNVDELNAIEITWPV